MKQKLFIYFCITIIFIGFIMGCSNTNEWYVLKNNIIYIKLSCNPTTGYYWYYSIEDSNIVSLENETYTPNNTEANFVGSGGIWSCEIIAKADGYTNMFFYYKRHLEDEFIRFEQLSVEVSDNKIFLLN